MKGKSTIRPDLHNNFAFLVCLGCKLIVSHNIKRSIISLLADYLEFRRYVIYFLRSEYQRSSSLDCRPFCLELSRLSCKYQQDQANCSYQFDNRSLNRRCRLFSFHTFYYFLMNTLTLVFFLSLKYLKSFILIKIYFNYTMVKVYYSYEFDRNLGQVISKSSNFAYDHQKRVFIAGVNQYVSVTSAKTGQTIYYLQKKDKNTPIRHIYCYGGRVYGGFEDGSIAVWDLTSGEQLQFFDLHKSTVTSIHVCEENNKLISAGMDGNIMIWDLLSQECSQIKSAHHNAITAVSTISILYKGKPTTAIVSIGKDGFFRVWNLETQVGLCALSCQVTEALALHVDQERKIAYVGTNKEDIVQIQFEEQADGNRICSIKGVIKKKSYARCLQLIVEDSLMYILSADKMIETYKVLSFKQIEARKKKVLTRKKKNAHEEVEVANIMEEIEENASLNFRFVAEKTVPYKFFNCVVLNSQIFLNNGTNICELASDAPLTKGSGRTNQICLEFPFLVQRSSTGVQVHNSNNLNKLFSIPVKAKWCCMFSGGFLMVVQEKAVQVWDLGKNQQIYKLEQQWEGCWIKKNRCLLWRENQVGHYQFGYNKQKKLTIKSQCIRSFEDKVSEAFYRNSQDKYIVSLINSQVHIQYADTHKNFLKLYGHKMPVLSLDIATDDSLLATGSIDKDIRFWDMDFGHCIKAIFAHQEAVTTVKFIPDTHYLLSGSKDGHIKFWDADTHQLIMDLQQNILQVKSIAVSQSGDFMIAGGLDQGLRVWKQTNDQTIASDMQEKQAEKVMIEDYAQQKLQKNEDKTSYNDLKHGQEIIEVLQNSEPPKIVLSILKKISPANLKSCLSFLHSRHVRRLEEYMRFSIGNGFEQQTCWRVLKQLERGSELGKLMRETWKPIGRDLRINTEGMKMLLRTIKEENLLQ